MSILVIVEQREGKLNRVSWETLTAGQALAAETGWPLEAAVVGAGIANTILNRMKYSNEIVDTVSLHVARHMRFRVAHETADCG